MRVLVLVTDAYGGTGGIAQYNRDLIAALARYPDTEKVTVIPRVIAREPEPLPARTTHLHGASRGKLQFTSTVLGTAARGNVDWIVCAHINLLPAAVAAAALSGARIILVTYGIEVWYHRGWITRLMLAFVFGFVSISEITFAKMRAWTKVPENRSFLIPNAIDLATYAPGTKNESLIARLGLQGRRTLLTVGRMDAAEQAKGFDEILEVLPAVREEMPDVAYIAVGDGSDRARLEAKARGLGLEDHVRFAGYVDEAEKRDYYRLANVFVMPSRLEGFGYVFLEALAVGVPVIASKIDGSREALRNGTWGLLVDPARPDELVAAIRSALLDPVVPPRSELEYFSTASFEKRCHEALAAYEAFDK
ncbi:MAG TPA: glycosyltransferase family 4 protein [Gemmatimonadaceae bacterium]|nr:glycosyltransferase family 4 protein [Gemmatimonadaceae bacterium]